MNLRDLYYNNGNRNAIVFSVLFLYNAVMDFSKPRIGLLVASIHTGSARSLWFPLLKEASRSNISFFVFPGGRLNFEMESECLRNSIYRLANSRNLDGLISWGSAIGSSVPAEELLNFHKQFQNLPYVTIAHKIPGHPCVAFDAYSGMAKLVRHFITVHGASQIAFIRGPEYHVSASERFQAFCDIMAEHGIDMTDSPLVTTPRNWSEGAAAAAPCAQSLPKAPLAGVCHHPLGDGHVPDESGPHKGRLRRAAGEDRRGRGGPEAPRLRRLQRHHALQDRCSGAAG